MEEVEIYVPSDNQNRREASEYLFIYGSSSWGDNYHDYDTDDYGDSDGGGGNDNQNNNKIINKLKGKAECVYDKLQNNSILTKTLEKFTGEKTPVHLIINQKFNLRVDDKNPNSPLVHGKTYYGDSYYITITLNTEQANNRPSLAVARTLLHEAIHAEIYRKVKSTTSDISKILVGNISWPTLFNYYNEHPDNPHHNYMADYYRDAIEKGLKEYAASIGETHTDQFYKDMAWSGLLDTKTWEKQCAGKVYADKEKTRIKKVIVNYENSSKNECN